MSPAGSDGSIILLSGAIDFVMSSKSMPSGKSTSVVIGRGDAAGGDGVHPDVALEVLPGQGRG